MERALFECEKFKQLIAAAEKLNLLTAKAKAKQWKRQLERSTRTYERLRKLRQEMTPARKEELLMTSPSRDLRMGNDQSRGLEQHAGRFAPGND